MGSPRYQMRPDYVETGPLKAWKACAVLEPHSDNVRIGPGRSPCSSTSSGPTRRRPTPGLQHKVLLVVGRMPVGATEQEAAVAEILRPWCG